MLQEDTMCSIYSSQQGSAEAFLMLTAAKEKLRYESTCDISSVNLKQ